MSEIAAIRDYMAAIQGKVSKTDERVARIDERIAGIAHALGEGSKRHSDRFERVEKRIDNVSELCERRSVEMWDRVDERLDRFDSALADFFEKQAANDLAVKTKLADVEKQQAKDEVDRKWTTALSHGASAVISGIIVAVISSMLGGSCVHTSDESHGQARAGSDRSGNPSVAVKGTADGR